VAANTSHKFSPSNFIAKYVQASYTIQLFRHTTYLRDPSSFIEYSASFVVPVHLSHFNFLCFSCSSSTPTLQVHPYLISFAFAAAPAHIFPPIGASSISEGLYRLGGICAQPRICRRKRYPPTCSPCYYPAFTGLQYGRFAVLFFACSVTIALRHSSRLLRSSHCAIHLV
jgi:hypothetical protein